MKLGISIKIDVKKIIKERLYQGVKGTYLDLTTFIDIDNEDTYGNNGIIFQSVSKEEREQGVKTPILGNVKVFSKQDTSTSHTTQTPEQSNDDDDIPF